MSNRVTTAFFWLFFPFTFYFIIQYYNLNACSLFFKNAFISPRRLNVISLFLRLRQSVTNNFISDRRIFHNDFLYQ